MRKIKFKGISIEENKLIEGSLLQINNRSYIYPSDYGDMEDVDFGYAFREVKSDTVELIDEI